jgi:hypothetical protein
VLVDGLAQLDYGPSIVPTIEQMSFPLCPQSVAKLSGILIPRSRWT